MSITSLTAIIAFAASMQAAPVTITGKVVDEAGDALPGAQVWVIGLVPVARELGLVGATTVDAEGRFAVMNVDLDGARDGRPLLAAAHHEGLAIGWRPLREGGGDVEIVCRVPVRIEGRIVTAEGAGIAAEVRPWRLHRHGGTPGDYDARWLRLPDQIAWDLAVKTDAEGRFSADWEAENVSATNIVRAPGYGEVDVSGSTFRELGEIVLTPAGSIRGRLVCEVEPQAAAGVHISSFGSAPNRGRYWDPGTITDEQGRFAIAEIRPGGIEVVAAFGLNARWQTASKQKVEVKSGEVAEVELNLEETFEVSGRVVEEGSGEPVAGLRLELDRNGSSCRELLVTNAEGRYTFRAPNGEVGVYACDLPEAYMQNLRSADAVVRYVDAIIPDIALKRGVTVRGVVVDAEGNPAPGARVLPLNDQPLWTRSTLAESDGSFRATGLDPHKPIAFCARRGDAMTREAVAVDVAEDKIVKLVVHEGVGVRLRARAVDDRGAPIAGAEVQSVHRAGRGGGPYVSGKTDAEGRWESGLLWPEGSYDLKVSARGHAEAKLPEWKAVPGETHDFGDVVLAAPRGIVTGTVVDTEGRPVVGARVFNSGDGPEAVETRADDQGRFRLEGLSFERAYVFGEQGELFGGVLVDVGSENAGLVLSPGPVNVTLGPPGEAKSFTSFETDRQVARALLEEARQLAEGLGAGTDELLEAEVALDPDAALEALAGEVGMRQAQMAHALCRHLMDERPDEALACIDMVGEPRFRAYLMTWAIEKMLSIDPERGRELFDTYLPELQASGSPAERAIYLAKVAEALWKVDPEAAEPTVREAEELAQGLGFSEFDAFARGCVADALCHIDLDAALWLLEGITDDYELVRHRSNIAARIAATQPERAEELMKLLDYWRRDFKLPRVVYRMAAAHPDRAIALAETATTIDARAKALGYAALALTPAAPDRALAAFERALALMREATPPRPDVPAEPYTTANTMGELAQIALQIGYPNVDRIAWRAIALRPARDPDYPLTNAGTLGMNLAFASPAIARDLLVIETARALQLPPVEHSGRREVLIAAAALIDANLAAQFVRSLPDDEPGAKRTPKLSLYSTVIERLLMPPESRYAEAMGSFGNWAPGADED